MCNIDMRIGIRFSVQAIALAILMLKLEVQTKGEYHDESGEAAADGTSANIEGPRAEVNTTIRRMMVHVTYLSADGNKVLLTNEEHWPKVASIPSPAPFFESPP